MLKFRCNRAALAVLSLALLLAGCQQQWPPPPPVPGQPLTFAQKHYRDLQLQQEMIDRRFR